MIHTLDFDNFAAGTVVDNEYADMGVTISATGGSGKAMIFDSANPTGGDDDLASDKLGGILIISEDGDVCDPDDNANGGSIFFDFEDLARVKELTFKDIEETTAPGTQVIFYAQDGSILSQQYIDPTGDNGERTVQFDVSGVARMEVRLVGSGAIDKLVFATNEGDVIKGGATDGDDVIDGTPEDDTIDGGTGDDLINGGAGDDSLTGGDGNDTLSGGAGDDTLDGGAGDDLLNGGEGDDSLIGGDGNDTLNGDAGNDTLEGGAGDDLLNGGDGDDLLSGGDGNDTLNGDAGNDTLNGDGGDDLINGGPGDDEISGGEGNDTLHGQAGNDFIQGNGGDDEITGGAGDDTLVGGDGNDTVLGGEGDDLIEGNDGQDELDGGPGNDSIVGGEDDDLITGGTGDDTLQGEGGNDTVDGGEGDDVLTGGDGDNILTGGDGNDTVLSGGGDDVIDTSGSADAPDVGYPTAATDALGYPADTDPSDDLDSVFGGDGNDTITSGDDNDTVTGGAGGDVINAGVDDDEIQGNEGDDRIVGGEGNDDILGGEGNDTIFGDTDPALGVDPYDLPNVATDGIATSPDRLPDNNADTIVAGNGDDEVFGGDDDDVINGGAGNDLLDGGNDDDTIDGGTGDDTLLGGQGDDVITAGEGNDSVDGGTGNDDLAGGFDQDLFVNVNAGDVVDGGEAGDDVDTLDLTGSAPLGGRLEVVYSETNPEDGTVFYYGPEDDLVPAGQLDFTNIENVIPCFTPGTKIATPKGERLVEELRVGDRIITRDNGMQEIRWVGAREMTGDDFEAAQHLRPVLIRQGALGNDLPERDMLVSPNHRVLVANDKTALYFEEREVLVAAKHLTDVEGIDIVDVSATTYIHLMFDQHEVILSDGTWTESFQPGDHSLAGIGDEQRNEIFEIFPELETREGIDRYASARRSLKKHEAKILTK